MDVKKEYYLLFGEMPFLLVTQSYDNEDYQILMQNAINRGKPLTQEEIEEYFQNDFDYVENKKNIKIGDI